MMFAAPSHGHASRGNPLGHILSAETPVLNKAIEGEAALRQGTLKANVRVAGRLSKQSHSVK